MATINLDIIFPAKLANGVIPKPVVIPEYAVAKQFDRINWTVYAVNTDIAETEIDFVNKPFFGPNKPKFNKKFKGKATIYAEVPDLNELQPVGAKYTVRGFDTNGTLLSDIDPEIIVDEP